MHQWLWGAALDFGGFRHLLHGQFISLPYLVSPAHLVTIHATDWMGRYADREFCPEEEKSSRPQIGYSPSDPHADKDLYDPYDLYGPPDPCIEIFEQLSQQAVYHLTSPTAWPPKIAAVFDESVKGHNHWLELLYRSFPIEPKRAQMSEPCPGLNFQLFPDESLYVTGLPWGAFLASARAIEMLIDRRELECPFPTPTTGASGHPANLSGPGEDKRPAYERDHLWLKWNKEEGLTPARIRDRWNGMSDDERRAASPRKWSRVESDSAEGQRDLIEKALRTARSE